MPANLPVHTVQTVAALRNGPICIGQGMDSTAIGVLSSFVLSSVIGLCLWLLFAFLRPKFRQVYGVREWFVPPDVLHTPNVVNLIAFYFYIILRPKPLGRSCWAFLWPPVPLVPPIPSDVSSFSTGENARADAALFPSDEELMQRTIWHVLMIALGWTILGLAGALPLYLVKTPCLARSSPIGRSGGHYSILHDLSVLRLLALVKAKSTGSTLEPSGHVLRQVAVDDADITLNTEVRLIVLTVMVIALAAAPAVFRLLREYARLARHHKHWTEVRCGGLEMGWLSRTRTNGFDGWGEARLKDFIIRIGLSKGFKNSGAPREGYAGVGAYGRSARNEIHTSTEGDEKACLEIDLQGLFTIVDTTRLAGLIQERDIVLNNLELSETQYINSFKLSTPVPSVIDYQITEESPEEQEDPITSLKRRISRPRALKGSVKRNRHHSRSATAPTSYVAPSLYYKLRDVRGVEKISPNGADDGLAWRISKRVIGSRFQELHRDSTFGHLPLGSHVLLNNHVGSFEPMTLTEEQLRFGPNDPLLNKETEGTLDPHEPGPNYTDALDARTLEAADTPDAGPSTVREGELLTPTTAVGSEEFSARPRPARRNSPPSAARRSTFAMRPRPGHSDLAVPPPHLRLQPQQPFVRPVSGMDHDELGVVYANIREWRSRLKAINAEIIDAQAEGYRYIADGEHVKGWLLVGRGVRFLPGVQMIEGRSKEDIRYHELQREGGALSAVTFWMTVGMISITLSASLIAVTALVVVPAPGVAHLLNFLQSLSNSDNIGVALATTLAPAVAASLFIAVALFLVHYAARFSGKVSIAAARITAFKTTFLILTAVCCIWLVACGSMIFALEAFADSAARAETVASGSVYIAAFLLVLVINVAAVSPALLMLQPLRLWRLVRRERSAMTPRQRFRAVYPRAYDPSYVAACCIVAVTFAAGFSLIFPLIAPAVCILLLLTLVAHRYLIGYVYARTDSGCTGGVLQMWLVRCFADLIALQPVLLGLIFLTRRLWVLGGVLIGSGLLIITVVEVYTRWKSRLPGTSSLSHTTTNSLLCFEDFAISEKSEPPSEDPSLASTTQRRAAGLPRNSMASVLEMMSLTLAVMPSSANIRGPVPLPTEDLDDLTATEQAARTNPNAPPRLPPLLFMTHSEEMQGIMYAPELIAPPPVIWLPNDHSGVAQSEAYDLQRWHDLKTTLDIISSNAIPRQSTDTRPRDNSISS